MPKLKVRWLIIAVIAVSLVFTPLFGNGQRAWAQDGYPRLLVDEGYFPALHKALEEAKDSVYVAMYIIREGGQISTFNRFSLFCQRQGRDEWRIPTDYTEVEKG